MTTFAPRHVDLWPWSAWKSSTFDSTVRTADTAALGLGYLQCNATTSGKALIYDVALDAGTWSLNLIRGRGTASGIITPSIGGVDLSTVDAYGAAARNIVNTITGITIAAPGVYEMKFRTDTKNASATAYNCAFFLITLTRTGA